MTSKPFDLIEDLQARGLVAQMTSADDLLKHLQSGARTLYSGFDPTADSLHIGHLVPLLTLRRFQLAGHRPIALVGGATGLIGDPSFKAQERKLNTPEVVAGWVDKLRHQVAQFVDFDDSARGAIVVNNLDWMEGMGALDFLRLIGKHFSVNTMIQKESVKQRLEREGEGISFTEFSYMLLQSYDFAELSKRYDCSLQVGGSDQWGNIVGGVDLARRMYGRQVFGLTTPLVAKADGTKFGKTESGTVWLDPAKTSPYAFYQFWINAADADVYKFLRYFTFLSPQEIDEIELADRAASGRPQAQAALAALMTELVHGASGLAAARRISEALFSGEVNSLSEGEVMQLKLDGLPAVQLRRDVLEGLPLTQLLGDSGLATGKQVKDALAAKAVLLNGRMLDAGSNMNLKEVFAPEKALHGCFYILRLGKKKYQLIEIAQ